MITKMEMQSHRGDTNRHDVQSLSGLQGGIGMPSEVARLTSL